jgi:DNA mismatch repair protein MutS
LFLHNLKLKEQVEEYVRELGDLERIISKVAVQRINPREVVQLKIALDKPLRPLSNLRPIGQPNLEKFAEQLNPCQSIADRIDREIYTPIPPSQ